MRRVVAGAPNEARFGFSQATSAGGTTAVAGQVGKDNRTGAMVDEADLAAQVRRAVANVHAAAGDATVVAVTAHLAAPVADALPVLQAELDASASLTVVRVPALSHDTYLAELSASAREATVQRVPAVPATAVPWAPAAVVCGSDVHVSACHGHGDAPGPALAAALTALADVLAGVGCEPADVLSEHVYVVGPVNAEGFAALCDVHAAAYADGAPASTLVLVDELVGGARVAVTATAHRSITQGAPA